MNDDDVWAAIDLQRRRTADLLAGLSEEQWGRPSLCEGWTVRDVAAHLTLQQMGPVAALRSALRHPGGLNHIIRESARDRARRPADRLVAGVSASVGSRRPNVGLTNLETLIDILVHGQDIAVPLGLELEMPPKAAAAAAERVRASGGTRKAQVFRHLPLEGFRLSATDVSWAAGEGPEIRGPIAALLLLLTGRRAGLDRLTGDGAEMLRQRLTTA
ncbi:UNVERIFIED_CONTAM: maleylpyruvate isomerase family mycothiol-dependent enzyme [Kocuria sp. CPCC 205316]|uniref:maleylpyruvate isomerase family mycothiol-dependent enzyme n=1 Tax=Kocuria TaxID=57493 RepID=UPI0036DB5C47